MIVSRLDNWRRILRGEMWRTAFDALIRLHGSTPDGETKLAGDDLIMRVQSYPTRQPDDPGALLETHREYIDIQTTLAGSERIDWFPAESLKITTPYDARKDVQFYERPGPAPASIDVAAGLFVILYPEDAHMAQLVTAAGDRHVKKVVVKVRLSKVQF